MRLLPPNAVVSMAFTGFSARSCSFSDVREGSRLGTQSGWERQFHADAIGLKAARVVRTGRVLARKSSKGVQTGEPVPGAPRNATFQLRRSLLKAPPTPPPNIAHRTSSTAHLDLHQQARINFYTCWLYGRLKTDPLGRVCLRRSAGIP